MSISEPDSLVIGRRAFEENAWADAFESLVLADRQSPLAVEDLERLATSAYLLGKDDDYLAALDRTHHRYLDEGKDIDAARCAFWLGLHLLLQGQTGPATGWLARAQRLVDDCECVERGYLLLTQSEQQLHDGEFVAAFDTATETVRIGEAFGDPDLVACARHLQGRALIRQGNVEDGLALLDEAMVAATSGELSIIVTGLIYCSVIEVCQQAYALGRAREWTEALANWCDRQPQMVAFTATCLVHRAEIMQRHGAWPDAIAEVQRACTRFSQKSGRTPPAAAYYQEGEVHRLRGQFDKAEEAYRKASRFGVEPQPGLALLRLAQGSVELAESSIRRVLGAASDPARRAKLLPGYVEIMLEAKNLQEASDACTELEELARASGASGLSAMAAHSRGAVALASGDPRGALASLRIAFQMWKKFEVPYAEARARLMIGLACRALGDTEGAELELDAARAVLEKLGAAHDLSRLEALSTRRADNNARGLTPRELEVLRLVATGKTNKIIAEELFLSEKTVDRHVSNIFSKLDVRSRTAATAFAYENGLI